MSPEETQPQLPSALSFLPTNEGVFIRPLGFCANETSELISTRTHQLLAWSREAAQVKWRHPWKLWGNLLTSQHQLVQVDAIIHPLAGCCAIKSTHIFSYPSTAAGRDGWRMITHSIHLKREAPLSYFQKSRQHALDFRSLLYLFWLGNESGWH